MTTVYNQGLDIIGDWDTFVSFTALLLDDSGYVVDPDEDFIDLGGGTGIVAYETTVVGYTRQTVTTPTRTVDDALNRITYDCADFAFGSLTAGTNITAMVVFRDTGVDTTSIPIAYYPLGTVPTSGAAFPVIVNASGLLYTNQGA